MERNVSFVDAIKLGFSNYFNFSGRAQRAEYWWWYLFTIIGGLVAGIFDVLLLGADTDIGLLGAIFSLVTLIPTISAGVRRLHDIGKSGWWLLLVLIPIIGAIILIIWFIRDSERDANQWGPSPKYGSQSAVFD